MRKLMWFTIGFGVSCAVGAYLMTGNILAYLGAAILVIAGTTWLICRHYEWKPIPVAVLFGVSVGLFWYWGFDGGYLSPVEELDGMTTQAIIEITDFGFDSTYGTAADGNALWQGKTYRIRLYLDVKYPLSPGDIVSGTFRFRITDDGGLEEATYHRGNGIALIAYQTGELTLEHPDLPWWYYPAAYIRSALTDLITEVFPGDTEAFARALLLGDDTDIDYETNTAFKVSGIRHIIAVSGLHVSILFGFIYIVTGKRRVLTAVLGIPVLVLFAAVAGFTPSVTRACLMHGLMMLALHPWLQYILER